MQGQEKRDREIAEMCTKSQVHSTDTLASNEVNYTCGHDSDGLGRARVIGVHEMQTAYAVGQRIVADCLQIRAWRTVETRCVG